MPLVDDVLDLAQLGTPANPASGRDRVYPKSDDKLYIRTSGGTETLVGPSTGAVANASQNVACSGNANPTSTTNVTVAGLSITATSTSTSDVFMVPLDVDWAIVTAGSIGIVELLIDGTAQTKQMVIAGSAGITVRGPYHALWRITGLTAGSHTFTVRTRNTAGSTNTQVSATNSTMHVMRET